MTPHVKNYVEQHQDLLDTDLNTFTDVFFKYGYTSEDCSAFFEVLTALNLFKDLDQKITETQKQLAEDAKKITDKYNLPYISATICVHDIPLTSKQDLIEAKSFGNISLRVVPLTNNIGKELSIRCGQSTTSILRNNVEIATIPSDSIFIKSLNSFYDYSSLSKPFFRKFEAQCKKIRKVLDALTTQ